MVSDADGIPLVKRAAAEAIGTALLLSAVVGSGIMGERLAGGNVAIALLANTISTGAALVALIAALGPVSGAHFNPAVSIADATRGGIPWREVPAYLTAQVSGAFGGVMIAHVMFGEPIVSASQHVRSGAPQLVREPCRHAGARGERHVRGHPAGRRARLHRGAGRRSDRRDATLRLDGSSEMGAIMNMVIFACVHNGGRSQMAAALFNRLADPVKARAISAGTDPGPHVHPEVVEAMRELGCDLSTRKPQKLTDELAAGADVLVTMGCGEACPVVPGARREDWPLEDPKGKALERVREIREEIAARVQDMLVARDWLPWRVRPADRDDQGEVESLLREAALPIEGVTEHFADFVVAVDADAKIVGVAGLERYGAHALLRSVAVDPAARAHGLGSVLARRVLLAARTGGASEVYLLTTTAERFFERRGFRRIERSDVPPDVRASVEFNGICPESATVMRLRLSIP